MSEKLSFEDWRDVFQVTAQHVSSSEKHLYYAFEAARQGMLKPGEWLPIDPEALPPARPEGYWVKARYQSAHYTNDTKLEPKIAKVHVFDNPQKWPPYYIEYHTGPGAPKEGE